MADPTLVGLVSNANKGNLHSGLMVAIIFPIIMFVSNMISSKKINNKA